MRAYFFNSITVGLACMLLTLLVVLSSRDEVVRQEAVLDLADVDIESEIISLDGPWRFYWQKLLTASAIKEDDGYEQVRVPSVWNDYGPDKKGEGYGTYGLKVLPKEGVRELSLRMPHMSTAYRVYIDDTLLHEVGRVSSNPDNIEAIYKRTMLVFEQPKEPYWVVVQIANKDYARGGFWYGAQLGKIETVYHQLIRNTTFEAMLIGALLIMGIYHFCISFGVGLRKKALNQFVIFTSLVMRVALTGELLLYQILDVENTYLFIRLEYVTIIIGPYFYLRFLQQFFGNNGRYMRHKVYSVVMALSLISIALLPLKYMTAALYYYEVLALVMLVAMLVTILIAWYRKNTYSGIFFVSVVMFITLYVLDIAYHANILTSTDFPLTAVIGFLIVLIHSVVLIRNVMAQEREKSAVLESKMAFLQAQIKPHFVQNALNAAISLIESNPMLAEELLLDFSDYLRGNLEYTGSDKPIPITEEIKKLRSYTVIQKTRYGTLLEVIIDFDGQAFLIPPLMIQPLVENAIKHNIEKCGRKVQVTVRIRTNSFGHYIEVSDDGEGFDVGETTFGIGLTNIKKRLKILADTDLKIISSRGQGTKVSFRLGEKEEGI